MSSSTPILCPCCSRKTYQECCQRYHNGLAPENALALMRSRYSAYAMHLADYIVQTTHRANPRFIKDTEAWAKQVLEFAQKTQYEKLEIVSFQDGSPIAYVTFTAHLKQGDRDLTFTEKSTFEKVGDRWMYLNGEYTPVK
jgi:SEC-C motif-containing protein